MLKNIKLYSLLAIIVASTVVGLFGFSTTVSAQAWLEGAVGERIVNGSETCVKTTDNTYYVNSNWSGFYGFDDKLVFRCSDTVLLYFKKANGSSDFDMTKVYRATFIKCSELQGDAAATCSTSTTNSNGAAFVNESGPIQFNSNNSTDGGNVEGAKPKLLEGPPATWVGSYAPGDPASGLSYAGYTFTAQTSEQTDLRTLGGIPSDAIAVYAARQVTEGDGSTLDYFIYLPAGTDLTDVKTAEHVVVKRDSEGKNGRSDQGTIEVDASTAGDEVYTDGDSPPPSCQIKGIGWLLCPVVNFIAEVTDASYWLLDKTLLKLEPIALPNGTNDNARMQLYTPWRGMRDFANIVFIIGFLVIVFSQLTNVGITNYGIKRLLPKIIVAAILVNLSYYICAFAVDLSNILGNSLRGLLNPDGGAKLLFESTYDSATITGQGWTGIAGVILGGTLSAIAVYAFLPVFLPLVLSAAMAVVTVVVALTIRQALVVILIIVSPLAFVALLLPNTEGYFHKWRTLFVAMLMVYPIISIVFGASALASNILMNSTNDFWMQMVGAGVSIVPLFITPIVMKVSGAVLSRIVGQVNNPSKGPIDGARKKLNNQSERIDNRRKIGALTGKGRFGGRLGTFYRGGARGEAIDAGVKSEAHHASSQYVSHEIEKNNGDNRFARSVAGSDSIAARERAIANAKFTIEKAEIDEVKAASALISSLNFSELAKIVNDSTSSNAKIAAALDRMITISDPGDYEKHVNHYGSRTEESESIIRRTLQESLSKNNPLLRASDLDNIANGQMGKDQLNKKGEPTGEKNASTMKQMANSNVGAGILSESKMATASTGVIDYARDSALSAGDAKAIDKISKTATKLLDNPQLSGNIQHNERAIRSAAIATLPLYGPPAPAAPASPTPPALPAAPGSRPEDV